MIKKIKSLQRNVIVFLFLLVPFFLVFLYDLKFPLPVNTVYLSLIAFQYSIAVCLANNRVSYRGIIQITIQFIIVLVVSMWLQRTFNLDHTYIFFYAIVILAGCLSKLTWAVNAAHVISIMNFFRCCTLDMSYLPASIGIVLVSIYYGNLCLYCRKHLTYVSNRNTVKRCLYDLFRLLTLPDKDESSARIKQLYISLHSDSLFSDLKYKDTEILKRVTKHMIRTRQYYDYMIDSKCPVATLNLMDLLYNDLTRLISSAMYLKKSVFQSYIRIWNERVKQVINTENGSYSDIFYEVCVSGVEIVDDLTYFRSFYEDKS